MINSDGVETWPCPSCGGGYPDGCRCGSLWAWGARPGGEAWESIRHLLACRCGGHCEICGNPLTRASMTVHHRDARGMGGTRRTDINDLSNLMALCGGALGGVVGCHGHVEHNPAEAYRVGWKVREGADSAKVPITLPRGREVLKGARVRLAREVPEYISLPPELRYAV